MGLPGEPGLGAVPRVWTAPARNADFTGRGAVLDTLREELTGGGATVVLAQALYGPGGIGKTQIALEFAHRFQADYDLVLVDPRGTASRRPAWPWRAWRLPGSASRLATTPRTQPQLLLSGCAAAQPARWLLIFYNAEDPGDLEGLPPRRPGPHHDHLAEPGVDASRRAD